MNIGAEVVRFVSRSVVDGYKFVERNLDVVQTALILVSLAAVGLIVWRSYSTSEIVLLAGPNGGDGELVADAIVDAFNRDSSVLGGTYRIRKELTDGFEENRRRIENDTSGLVFALAHDGFGESTRIRTLLPLNNSVLHVLCRKEFWENCTKSAITVREDKGNKPFNEVVMQINSIASNSKNLTGNAWQPLGLTRSPRVYLGPPDSGTRQMGTIVADYYQLPYEGFAPTGIADWVDTRRAFRSGELDIAFFLGPPNSMIINQIASDGLCCLLDLEEVDAIVQGHGQVLKATLAEHSYAPGESFCPTKVSTLATRRVLICSTEMDTTTGFQLAVGTRDALRPRIPHLEWSFAPPKEKIEPQLSYLLHPGAEYVSVGRTPGVLNWIRQQISTWWSALASIFIAAVASFLSWANTRKLPLIIDPDSNSTEQKVEPVYAILLEEIRESLQTLVHTEHDFSSEDYKNWEMRVTELRKRIKASQVTGRLSADEYEALHKGLRELRAELEFFHQKGKRKTTRLV
jgi:hypothetical protein